MFQEKYQNLETQLEEYKKQEEESKTSSQYTSDTPFSDVETKQVIK